MSFHKHCPNCGMIMSYLAGGFFCVICDRTALINFGGDPNVIESFPTQEVEEESKEVE